MVIGKEKLTKELSRQILARWLLPLGRCQEGSCRLEGEAEASARGLAAKPVPSLLTLCTRT